MNAVVAKSAATVILAAASIGYTLVASADRLVAEVGSVPTATVKYGDLNIGTPQGLEMLYARINRAARAVCGFDHSHKELQRSRPSHSCYRAAVENAVNKVNQPTLTALHRSKSKAAVG